MLNLFKGKTKNTMYFICNRMEYTKDNLKVLVVINQVGLK